MRQKWVWTFFLYGIAITASGCGRNIPEAGDPNTLEVTYTMTDTLVQNPYIGFAVEAANLTSPDEHSLVYIDITFAELQPDSPDAFDLTAIAEENNIDFWRSQGKHAVLRFICDLPGKETHMDIPQWLYDLTGDGDFYDISYGKGYSPDYSNEVFIFYHQKAIAALGGYFSDGFVSYVQLGSLGHWGEWHVLYSAGIKRLPGSETREQYVQHYIDAFPDAKLLMRWSFAPAAENSFGLYNDMSGHADSTYRWLDRIENGGEFTQTNEPDALAAMPEFWKTAPVGGEFTSSLPMWYLCGPGLKRTLSLLKASHTSFLGPKCPVSNEYHGLLYRSSVPRILRTMGYRIGITRVTLQPDSGTDRQILKLQWENHGCAPIYFDTPVKLYLVDTSGSVQELADIQIDLTKLQPDEVLTSTTELPAGIPYNGKTLALGIIDPMTGQPSVGLVSDQEQIHDRLFALFQFP